MFDARGFLTAAASGVGLIGTTAFGLAGLFFGCGSRAKRPEPALLGSTLTLGRASSSSSLKVDREGMVILTGPLCFAFFAGGSST